MARRPGPQLVNHVGKLPCDGTGKIRKADLPAGGQKVGETCRRCGGTGKDAG